MNGSTTAARALSRARVVFGGCLLAGLLGGPSCNEGGEDIGELQQPLFCVSVAVCDDADPCTDDLCVANLCVNVPLANCPGGAGNGGAGGDIGVEPRGGESGSLGGSDGTSPELPAGGNGGDRADGGPDVAVGGSRGEAGAVGASGGEGTSQAGDAAVSSGAAGAPPNATGAAPNASDADSDAWWLQGGGCMLPAGPRPAGASTAWALLSLLVLGGVAARRRALRGRTRGEPDP